MAYLVQQAINEAVNQLVSHYVTINGQKYAKQHMETILVKKSRNGQTPSNIKVLSMLKKYWLG